MTGFSPVTGLILAIDPGRDKCGLAVVDGDAALFHHSVVPTVELGASVGALMTQFAPDRILLGNGTTWRKLRPVVEDAIGDSAALEVVNERHTTERAREEYWRRHPPRGLRRLVPRGLQVPPEPYDDFAAYVMALDYLANVPK